MAYAALKENSIYQGAAAYDLYGTAVRRPRENRLPQDRPQVRPRTRTRSQSPLILIMEVAAAAVVLLLVVFSQMKLYEVSSQVSTLQQRFSSVQEEQALLRSRYDSAVDLAAIEAIAVEQLGMSRSAAGQTVYVNLSGSDRAEVLTNAGGGIFSDIARTVREAFSNLGEYLS